MEYSRILIALSAWIEIEGRLHVNYKQLLGLGRIQGWGLWADTMHTQRVQTHFLSPSIEGENIKNQHKGVSWSISSWSWKGNHDQMAKS